MLTEQPLFAIPALMEDSELDDVYDDDTEFDDDTPDPVDFPLTVYLGDGVVGKEYEGHESSFMYARDLFKPDGTLQDRLAAVYLEDRQYEENITRIEADGTWTRINPPNELHGDFRPRIRRGIITPQDLGHPLYYKDGSEDENRKAIIFGYGLDSVGGIFDTITTVDKQPQVQDDDDRAWYEKNLLPSDVEERFSAYLTYGALDYQI